MSDVEEVFEPEWAPPLPSYVRMQTGQNPKEGQRCVRLLFGQDALDKVEATLCGFRPVADLVTRSAWHSWDDLSRERMNNLLAVVLDQRRRLLVENLRKASYL
jgi:hypothetical protein